MKKPETAIDAAIKRASATQRAAEKDDFPEGEDPAEYNRRKGIIAQVHGEFGRKEKKEIREIRDRNKRSIDAFVKQVMEQDASNAKEEHKE